MLSAISLHRDEGIGAAVRYQRPEITDRMS
jgi:hypothetical protein